MAGFVEGLRARAAALDCSIVFPESHDARVVRAAEYLVRTGTCRPVLVLDPAHPGHHEAARRTGAATIDAGPENPLELAARLVASGSFDGLVAGAQYTTAEVLRAALRLIGPRPGLATVSSAFYMVANREWEAEAEVLTFADCAVVPNPDAGQLADIALAAAADRRLIVGDEPRVALLSYSTAGSAAGESVERIREAVGIIRAKDPTLVVDGELQGDAALVPSISERKAAGSPVGGKANVLVFPSLDAGNIAYKLVQRLAMASAVGPVLQGLARPASDLSRGAGHEDIINVAAIAALQSSAVAGQN